MTLIAEIYEMEYSCSPGGVDCWEVNIEYRDNDSLVYAPGRCVSDFKTAGEALTWLLDQYPAQMLKLTVTSLKAYNICQESCTV